MKQAEVSGLRIFAPASRKELIHSAFVNKSILVAVNAEKILHANQQMKAIINRNVGYPDGIGAVWALKKKGLVETEKIPGCELWLTIVEERWESASFYLVGASEDVIQETVGKLKNQYPGISILNFRNGFLKTQEERAELIEDIALLKPDVVFVAMGSPKQELLMEEMYNRHPAVYQGLGGSFDVFTDHVKRAPKWWVKNNLEWAYRMIRQPARIKRQVHLLRFFILLKLNRL